MLPVYVILQNKNFYQKTTRKSDAWKLVPALFN